MKEVNGVKIFKVGECDWVFAKDAEEAIKVMVEMTGEDYSDVEELSDEEFEKGQMYWAEDGDISRAVDDDTKKSFKDVLNYYVAKGSKSGHFMTTEW